MGRETRLNVRMSDHEKKTMEQAAGKEHLGLASWVRQTLLRKAREILGR